MRQSKNSDQLFHRPFALAVIVFATASLVMSDVAAAGMRGNFGGGLGGSSVQSRFAFGGSRGIMSQPDFSGRRSADQFSGTYQIGRSSQQWQTQQGRNQSGRQDLRGDRQGDRQEWHAANQDGRTDRTELRQDGRTDRVELRTDTRRDVADDIANNNYWGHYDYHRNDYWNDNNAAWAFFGGLVLGAAIAGLPPSHETIVVYDTTYYYANGAYYQVRSDGNYVVVPAPQGAIVQHAPSQITNVYVNGEEYGYANGAYYDVRPPAEEGGEPAFEVVAPPVGATVGSLPDGATSETVNDAAYFVYAGTYYKPFYAGSDVVYMVVTDPKA